MVSMKGGGPQRQFRAAERGLPPDFMAAHASWHRMNEAQTWDEAELSRIRSVVARHLEFVFVPSNLKDGTTLAESRDRSIDTFVVTDSDFRRGPIPTISVKAVFELSFSQELPAGGIVQWQADNDSLSWAFSFRYGFEFEDDIVEADCGALLAFYGPLE
jgi:hypothetical protein